MAGPSSAPKKERKSKQIVDDALSILQTILSIGGDALQFAPVSGLDTAASILCSLVESIQKTRANDVSREEFSRSIISAAEVIREAKMTIDKVVKTAGPKSQEEIKAEFSSSDNLKRRVDGLIETLNEINVEAAKLSEGNFFKKFIRRGQTEQVLGALKVRVDNALRDFQTHGMVVIESLVDRVHSDIQLILENQKREHEERLRKDEEEKRRHEEEEKRRVEKRKRLEEEQRKAAEEQKRRDDDATLEKLPHVDAGYLAYAHQHKFKDGLLEGTRVALLQEIMDWAERPFTSSKDEAIFLLSGAAGTGKSTVAYEMAKRLERRKALAATFFFLRGDSKLSSLRHIFSTIAYQLAVSQAWICPHIVKTAKIYLKNGLQGLDLQMQKLIVEPLQTLDLEGVSTCEDFSELPFASAPYYHHPNVIIIDAADECAEIDLVPTMLQLLMKAVNDVPVNLRILITSRPEFHLERVFRSADFSKNAKMFRLHEIPQDVADSDIRLYLRTYIAKKDWGADLVEQREDAVRHLAWKAEGLFIFAATAIKFLDLDPQTVVQTFDILLSGKSSAGPVGLHDLDRLYTLVLKKAFSDFLVEMPWKKDVVQRILSCIALLRDNLALGALCSLLSIKKSDALSVLERLGSVVVYSDDPHVVIRPLHASFSQFLVDNERCKNTLFYVDPFTWHAHIAGRCFDTLSKPNILQSASMSDGTTDVTQITLKSDAPQHVQYACRHWDTHVRHCDLTKLSDSLAVFCKGGMSGWFEVLALQDELSDEYKPERKLQGEIENALKRLVSVYTWYRCQDQYDPTILDIFYDGYRCALDYYIRDNVEHKRGRTTIEDIPHVDASHLAPIHAPKSGLLEGTRTALLSELEEWANRPLSETKEGDILVLSGAVGTGKTTIAYELAKRLGKEHSLGASFFFRCGDEKLGSARLLFSTIAYQLALLQPSLYAEIADAASKYVMKGEREQVLQLHDIITGPLIQVSGDHPPVVIVIEAINECSESHFIPDLLRLVSLLVKEVPFALRVLITTRPEPDVEQALKSIGSKSAEFALMFRRCDISHDSSNTDICSFITTEIGVESWGGRLLANHPREITELTALANGSFVFATTAVRMLNLDPEHAVENLDTLFATKPANLDELYDVVLRIAYSQLQRQKPGVEDHFRSILAIVALQREHVMRCTLCSLLSMSEEEANEVFRVLDPGICYIENPEGALQPRHSSFISFLTDSNRCMNPTFYVDPQENHTMLAIACFDVLNKPGALRRNVCCLPNPATTMKEDVADLQSRILSHISAHLRYACLYCMEHATRGRPTPEVVITLKTFFEQKLLFWLEIMSILGLLEIAAEGLASVDTWYQRYDQPNFAVSELLHDGYRFVLQHFDAIDAHPEHIYASALPLVPEGRLFDVFSPLLSKDSLKLVTEREAEWSPCLRAVDHNWSVNAMMFSPNGLWIAAGGGDGIIRTWDAVSGRALNGMKDHDIVHGIGWMPDSQRIISASPQEGTISVWDAATGALLQSRACENCKSSYWVGFACSPCGRYFALPNSERVEVGSVDDLEQRVSTIAVQDCWHTDFSSDGSQILTSCEYTGPQIWDVKTGSLMKTLESGEEKELDNAIFLPSGRIAAFPKETDTVIIWDVESGKRLRTVKGPYGLRIRLMTASHRGDIIAVANYPSDIYLLDVQSGTYFAVLDTGGCTVLPLSFSPDDLRLMSGDYYKHACLWDLSSLSDRGKAVAVRDRGRRPFAFSPDGTLAAYETEERTIVVWDVVNCCRLSMIEGHTVRVDSIAISDDRSRVAAAARDGTVRIWKTESGELWKCFEGLQNKGRLVAFSQDNLRVASAALVEGTHELEVKYWSLTDGSVISEFRTDLSLYEISDFAFSPDGSALYVKEEPEYRDTHEFLMRSSDGESIELSQKNWKSQKEIEADARAAFDLTDDGWVILKKDAKTLFWLPESQRPDGYERDIILRRIWDPYFIVYDMSGRLKTASDSI